MTDRSETRVGGGRSSDNLDPAFIRRLEDDSLWRSERQTRPARPVRRRREKRSRWVALIVLVAMVLTIIVIGIATGRSSEAAGGGGSSPFTLLPLPGYTATTVPDPTDTGD